jgi:autotransporter-associated beta strand protein
MTGLLNNVMAANYYWDIGTATGYQPGNGTWDSSAFWTLNGTTLTTWPGDSTNNAYFGTTAGTSIVSINGTVEVTQLGFGWTGAAAVNSTYNKLTNGTLRVGAGGIICAGDKNAVNDQAIWSDIVLTTNQTWSTIAQLCVNGAITDGGSGYGITKIGANTLSLYGTNSFSGDFIQSAGPVTVYSTSGLPLGSGSLTINNGLTLSITPAGSGSAVELQGGTNGNKTISFNGKAKIYVAKGSQNSTTFTYGNSADIGSVFVRNNRGLLSIVDTLTSGGIGVYGQFKLANGTNGVPVHNGMVDAYLTASDRTPYFMQYNEVAGFQKFTTSYSWGSGIQASVNDNTRVYQIGTATPVLTNDCSIYALSMTTSSQTLTLSNNAVLNLGNGSQPAGLILGACTITNAANSTGSRLDFGASEGIVYHTYNCTAAIAVPIAGSGGVTFNMNSAKDLTLSGDNTYTGDTTIHGGMPLNIGTGGTRGSLASTNWVISGGTLNFNRSDTLAWAGTMSGAGTVQNGGVGTLNLALTGSGNSMGTIGNTSSGTMTVIAMSGASNTFVSIKNSSTGTLVLDGVGSTNVVTGPSPSFGGAAGGTLVFSNGYYVSQGGQRNTAGNLTVAGGTFVVDASRLGINSSDGQQVNITSGSLVVTANCGIGLLVGNDSGAAAAGNRNCTFNQSGGSVSSFVTRATPLEIGGTTGSKTNAYYLSGGLMNLASGYSSASMTLGADTNGTTLAQFSMTGGKLISAGIIKGAQGAGARQVFDFSGGTLAAYIVTASNLASTNAPTVQGTLVNNGGTLAPGDIGTAGKTTITGNYTESSDNAALAIDIGGTTQATAFQTGQYDYLNVTNGAATIAGRLDVRLINGYTPPTTDTKFTILAVTGTGAALSGTFANVTAGNVWCADGYSLFTNVTQSATNVILSGYAANEYLGGSWDSTSSWSQGVIPANQDYAAYFGTLASDFSPNEGTRTLKGLVFANPSSFTLSGTALTLQGDASIKVTAGSHMISVPLALSNATEIAVAPDSLLTLSGTVTGAQNVAKTGTGTLALSGVNTTLGALTVSAGTVRFTAGTTTVSGLTIASGAKCDFVTGTLYILKNGGGTDTIEEVNAAITANAITLRGSNATSADFKVTEEGAYIKVTAMVNGTLISFQ